jgi:hypothetical protein
MNNDEEQIKSIQETIDFMKQIIKTEMIINMKKENYKEYELYLIQLFPTFYDSYPTLFKNVIDEKDLSFLDQMFEGIIKIGKNKKSKKNIEKDLGEKLAEKYLYPNIPKKN